MMAYQLRRKKLSSQHIENTSVNALNNDPATLLQLDKASTSALNENIGSLQIKNGNIVKFKNEIVDIVSQSQTKNDITIILKIMGSVQNGKRLREYYHYKRSVASYCYRLIETHLHKRKMRIYQHQMR